MSQPEFSAEKLPLDAPKATGDAASAGNMRAETQLSAPNDVSNAHQFFAAQNHATLPGVEMSSNAGGGSALLQSLRQPASFLPAFDQATSSFVGGFQQPGALGATFDKAALASSLNKAALPGIDKLLPGLDKMVTPMVPGGEAALAGMPAAPGAEQVSPLVQLILKMPGLTGLLDSVFSFLAALFHGNLLQAFDPILWAQQAQGALSHLGPASLDHFPVSINLLPSNAPFLQFLADGSANFLSPGGLQNIMQLHNASGAVTGSMPSNLNINGPVNMQKPLFEATPSEQFSREFYPQDSQWSHFGRPHDIAINPEIPTYRPTMGGTYQPSFQTQTPSVDPSQGQAPQPASTNHSHAASHAKAHHSAPHKAHHAHHDRAASHHSDASSSAGSDSMIAQSTPTDAGSADYTIQPGDSLWDIARKQLGDGTRWHELYSANADAIGGNPDLIHPGTTLHMPNGGELTAAGKYVVQPGDSLWKIASNHMGGGQNWGQIYSANQGVIGDNPGLIYPGQQLDLGGGAQSMTASAPPQATPDMGSTPDASAAQSAQSSMSAQSATPSYADTATPAPSPQPEASPAVTSDGGVVNSTGVPAYSSRGVAPEVPPNADGQSQAGNQNYQ